MEDEVEPEGVLALFADRALVVLAGPPASVSTSIMLAPLGTPVTRAGDIALSPAGLHPDFAMPSM